MASTGGKVTATYSKEERFSCAERHSGDSGLSGT